MVALNRQSDQGELMPLTIHVHLQYCISTSEEYEPLVNEDETPHSTVRDLPPFTQRHYRDSP
jgi:hypothetical protein